MLASYHNARRMVLMICRQLMFTSVMCSVLKQNRCFNLHFNKYNSVNMMIGNDNLITEIADNDKTIQND